MLAALLLQHLRQSGVHAIAIKPFCSGSRADARLFRSLQGDEFSIDEINPFFFPDPLAPLLAARKLRRKLELPEVLERIHGIERKCECVIVEGIGGIMVPLGEDFMVREIIRDLAADVCLVGRNRLGTINHTLLSAMALKKVEAKHLSVVLMDVSNAEASSESNEVFLQEVLKPSRVLRIPFLGYRASRLQCIKENHKKMKKVLARILRSVNFTSFF